MRLRFCPLACCVFCSLLSFAQAQTALEELEKKLREPAGAASLPPDEPQPPAESNGEPGYLGVIADDRQNPGQGVRIVEVVEAGPAESAGLMAGDVVTAVAGQAVGRMSDMAAILEPLAAGTKVSFSVLRAGQEIELPVVLGSRPEPGARRAPQFGRLPAEESDPAGMGRQPSGPLLGIRTQTVTEDVRERLGLREAAGALVVARTLGSPAERAGIPLDAVIVAVDGNPVASSNELAQAISSAGRGATIRLTTIQQGRTVDTPVTLATPSEPAAVRPPRLPAEEGAAPRDDDLPSRIDRLERRVRELEQRLQELEAPR